MIIPFLEPDTRRKKPPQKPAKTEIPNIIIIIGSYEYLTCPTSLRGKVYLSRIPIDSVTVLPVAGLDYSTILILALSLRSGIYYTVA